MNAIEATRRQVRELVDGTLEVKLHVEPRFKAAFHQLFADIDMPVAIAPLRLDAAPMAAEEPEKLKGGALARLAGQLCSEPLFQSWLSLRQPNLWRIENRDIAAKSEIAARVIRCMCGVTSRAEIDHDAIAAEKFHSIRRAWAEFNAK